VDNSISISGVNAPSKGRRSGYPNYKKTILINIIESILPTGAEGWRMVAERYKVRSEESFIRDGSDMKRHFIEKMCLRNKKFTGQSAPPLDVKKAQEVYRAILAKGSMISAGNEESEDDESVSKLSSDSEDENYLDIGYSHIPKSVSSSQSTSTSLSRPSQVVTEEEPVTKRPRIGLSDSIGYPQEKSKNSRNGKRGNIAQSFALVAESMVSRNDNSKMNQDLKMEELRLVREELTAQREADREDRRIEREESARRFETQREDMRQTLQVLALSFASLIRNKEP
jgi:hypothetical protein